MKRMLGPTLALNLLALSTFAAAQVTPADCAESTRFKGKRAAFAATRAACATPKFFDGAKLKNPPLDAPNFKRLPVCLGFGQDITAYMEANGDKCRRLDSSAWTEGLNMSFVDCIAKGFLGPKPLWVSKPSAVKKDGDGWKNLVTFAELCRMHKLHRNWAGRAAATKVAGKRTPPKRPARKPARKPADE